MSENALNRYQKLAFTTAVYPRAGTGNYDYPLKGLVEEVGEIAGHLKRVERDDASVITTTRLLQIEHEMGDVLWYLAALATELGLSLSEISAENLVKVASRKERNAIHGEGSER